jgi:hypothetical protein
MFSKADVAVGDRFMKVGSYRMPAWTVARISCANVNLPHAHLEKEGATGDQITVAVPALGDSTLYRKLPAEIG